MSGQTLLLKPKLNFQTGFSLIKVDGSIAPNTSGSCEYSGRNQTGRSLFSLPFFLTIKWTKLQGATCVVSVQREVVNHQKTSCFINIFILLYFFPHLEPTAALILMTTQQWIEGWDE
jgi:hypothetical protein